MKKRKFPELNGPEVEWSKEEKERLLQALHEYVNINVFAQGEGEGGGGATSGELTLNLAPWVRTLTVLNLRKSHNASIIAVCVQIQGNLTSNEQLPRGLPSTLS